MGCTVSKERPTKNQLAKEKDVTNDVIDRVAHEPKATDIWDEIADGADTIVQDMLFKWIDSSRERARKVALEEKHHEFVQGTLKVNDIQARFNNADKYSVRIKVQDHSFTTAFSEDTNSPKWNDAYSVDVGGKGVHIDVEIYHHSKLYIFPIAHGDWHLDGKVPHADVKVELRQPFLFGHSVVGECTFKTIFESKPGNPAAKKGDRGFIYADYLPVLDPNVPMPVLAKPDKAFSKQDNEMTLIMGAILVDWTLTGGVNTRKTVPQPLVDRVDNGKGDEFWTDRRLNGDCAGFIQEHPRTAEEPWDYQIEWDWTSFLDVTTDVKAGVAFPEYICSRFALSENKEKLIPHSIAYTIPGKKPVVQKNDGGRDWEKTKELYRSFEMNAQFTWTHVGVHFNVEQYAMALYRNLEENHPIWDLLTPHFKNLITNNRLVVRPKTEKDKGVVTMANVYTYGGQIKMLQARFRGLSFRDSPRRVVPNTLTENTFENCQETMWNLISQYVEEFFAQHPDITVDDQIKAMSADLVAHSPNKAPDAMAINNVDDLKQLCRYVIFMAIFYHAWVHWNNFDDFAPVLHYDRSDPTAPSEEEAAKLEDRSNMIQTFVEYVSPTLKQWPILDPELGGPHRLKELLWENATKINPNIQVATLIMSPNT